MSNKNKQYRYHIITFGCQMNKSDSERLSSVLDSMGLGETNKPEKADVIIMNSCSVRQTAEDRVCGLSYNFSKLKETNPDLIVGVTGCMPGRDKDGKLKLKLREVDLYFPIHEMVQLPKWLVGINPKLSEGRDLQQDYLALTPNYNKKFQAFVPIQTGCNHFCTYCVVPYARGTEVNRPLKQILDEVNELAGNGCLEVTLLGEIVNHYQAPDPELYSKNNPYKKNDFAKLLWEINQIKEIERVHWTAPHPIYMDEEVIDALTLPKQVNYLHLPVQSGNTEILKKMNRRHDREFFVDIIKKIRNKKPDIAIGTDLIVGFPGETEEQFLDTVSLYKECDFDIAYPAQYSERSGTLAAKQFEDSVPKIEKKKRWHRIQEMMEENTWQKNQKYVGSEVQVLVDKCENGYCFGNTKEMKMASFSGTLDMVGVIKNIQITKADTWVLQGNQIT